MKSRIELFKVKDLDDKTYFGISAKKDSHEMHLIKSCQGRTWCPEVKLWLLPYSTASWKEILSKIPEVNVNKAAGEIRIQSQYSGRSKTLPKKDEVRVLGKVQLSKSHEDALLQMQQQLIINRYQLTTHKNYLSGFREFLTFYPQSVVNELDKEHIRDFLLHKINVEKISESTQNCLINAIKFYYEHVEKRERFVIYDLRPRKPKTIPGFLSKEEIIRLLSSIQNEKHSLIIKLIYSAGLRLGELVRLKTDDIRVANNCILIRCSKGKKDRLVTLSEKVKKDIASYIEKHKPQYYLIEGQDGGPYSPRSVQNIFSNALLKSGITTPATVHTLRHSYATHLILDGTDIRIVQELLGHNTLKTTEIYTHITDKLKKNIKSPIDSLDI